MKYIFSALSNYRHDDGISRDKSSSIDNDNDRAACQSSAAARLPLHDGHGRPRGRHGPLQSGRTHVAGIGIEQPTGKTLNSVLFY